MSCFLTPLAAELEPYVPGEQPKDRKYVKLNTNENPYDATPKLKEAVLGELENMKRYPDPTAKILVDALGDYYGLKGENIFVGNGSDEVLALCFPAFFSGKQIMFADITYSFYPVYAQLFQSKVKKVPVDENFSIRPKDYKNAGCGIIITNPNAPTGKALSLIEVEEILSCNQDQVVILDEAYVDFGAESAVSLIPKYNNLLVVQTFSKSRSLAGLRCGFAMGSKELIDGLNRVKNSFNSYPLDRFAIAGCVAALKDEEYFQKTRDLIIETREETISELVKLGFAVVPSKANFVFMTHPKMDGESLFLQLREKGILVRYFKKPRIDQYLRVTIGTKEEMVALLKALREICQGA